MSHPAASCGVSIDHYDVTEIFAATPTDTRKQFNLGGLIPRSLLYKGAVARSVGVRYSRMFLAGIQAKLCYGFQPLALSSSLAFLTKVKSKMSLILMSRCTLVVFFISSIIDCKTLSSVKPSRRTSFDCMS